jgi:gliding motility-associated-like protein
VNQNFRVPTPSISAVSNPTSINCNGVPVQISYTNNAAQSLIPAAVATVVSWAGPAPQVSVTTGAQYPAYVPGIYSLTVQDNKNGCINTATRTIQDNTQPPVLANPIATSTLLCGATGAALPISLTSSLTSWNIRFTEYPITPTVAAFSNNQLTLPIGINQSGINANAYTADQLGQYEFIVKNNQTGCQTTGTIIIVPDAIAGDFTASPLIGFAPLNVTFNNTSSSAGTSTVGSTTIWSFGNGTSATTTLNIPVATTYTAPGTYTVLLAVKKGECFDTASKVIKVELPSKLEIPNVFTPNNDGSNDVFFLKVSSITEIEAVIYDRWGNKVHEVISQTGNIGWDGKSLTGEDCPSGTYFYIIKASGKDGQTYEQKGNVSLYR